MKRNNKITTKEVFSSLNKQTNKKGPFCPLPSYSVLDANLQHCGTDSSGSLLMNMRQQS